MDMRLYAKFPISDIETYASSMCYELAGRSYVFSIRGGETVSMSFSPFPAKEVRINGSERGITYYCAKISNKVLFISYSLKEANAAYTFDLDMGLVTRIVTDLSGKTIISFGGTTGAKGNHAFTQDMDGNTVHWTLGSQDTSIYRVIYGDSVVHITQPRTNGSPDLYSLDFRAVKITKNIYLQNATFVVNGALTTVNMLSSFWNQTCVGSIYEVSAKGVNYRLFAGYGRFVSEGGS